MHSLISPGRVVSRSLHPHPLLPGSEPLYHLYPYHSDSGSAPVYPVPHTRVDSALLSRATRLLVSHRHAPFSRLFLCLESVSAPTATFYDTQTDPVRLTALELAFAATRHPHPRLDFSLPHVPSRPLPRVQLPSYTPFPSNQHTCRQPPCLPPPPPRSLPTTSSSTTARLPRPRTPRSTSPPSSQLVPTVLPASMPPRNSLTLSRCVSRDVLGSCRTERGRDTN